MKFLFQKNYPVQNATDGRVQKFVRKEEKQSEDPVEPKLPEEDEVPFVSNYSEELTGRTKRKLFLQNHWGKLLAGAAIGVLGYVGLQYSKYQTVVNQMAHQSVKSVSITKGKLQVDGQRYDGVMKEEIAPKAEPNTVSETKYFLVIDEKHMDSEMYNIPASGQKSPFSIDEDLKDDLEIHSFSGTESIYSYKFYKDKSQNGRHQLATYGYNDLAVAKENIMGIVNHDQGPFRAVQAKAFGELKSNSVTILTKEIDEDAYGDYSKKIRHSFE